MSLYISVVVCTYNRNQVLCEALDKLLNQDYPNYELLVIDQSESHDDPTTAYLESIADKIRLIKPPFANLPAARNFSLSHTRGQIVVFFDDDMDVPLNTLSKLVDAYNKNPHISIITGFMSVNNQIDLIRYAGYSWGRPVQENSGLRELEVMDGGFMSFRKSALDVIGDFDEWIGTQMAASGEDHEYSMRARRAGFKIYLDTSIRIENRDWSEGGSERAKVDSIFKQKAMTNMVFYVNLKNPPYKGLKGWVAANWSLYRYFILNRSITRLSPKKILGSHLQFIESYRWAMNAIKDKNSQKSLKNTPTSS